MTTTGRIISRLEWDNQTAVSGTGTLKDDSNHSYSQELTDGDGSNEINRVWRSDRTLAAGANEELDLQSLTQEIFGGTHTIDDLTAIKAINISNTHATIGLTVGNAAANQWQGPLGAVANTITVEPNGHWGHSNPSSGWTVDATDRYLKIANGGAASVNYRISLLAVAPSPSSSSSGS